MCVCVCVCVLCVCVCVCVWRRGEVYLYSACTHLPQTGMYMYMSPGACVGSAANLLEVVTTIARLPYKCSSFKGPVPFSANL